MIRIALIFKWPYYNVSSIWNRTIMVNAPFLLDRQKEKRNILQHILHARILVYVAGH